MPSLSKEQHQRLIEGLQEWELYDSHLSLEENLIELSLYMGFLDDARNYLNQITQR